MFSRLFISVILITACFGTVSPLLAQGIRTDQPQRNWQLLPGALTEVDHEVIGLQAKSWSPSDVLQEMAPFISRCIQPTDGDRVFTRCLDTHSSVHAHWAAYRIARFLPEHNQLALDSDQALEQAKLRNEVNHYVTYGYAEAWFLLLAIEYERWAIEQAHGSPLRMRRFGDEVAIRLLEQYELNPPNPIIGEHSNPSWQLRQLHRWFQHIGNFALRNRVDNIVGEYFLGTISQVTLLDDILDPDRFFSIHGNWVHLVLETQEPDIVEAFLLDQVPYPDSHLAPNPLPKFVISGHAYGLGWSRTWALYSLARQTSNPIDRVRYMRAAEAHVSLGMTRHRILHHPTTINLLGKIFNFWQYDHWVPQFAVYAVTEE